MKKKIGKTSFTPTLPARSSASCLRRGAHEIGVRAQRFAHAGAEAVVLDQDRHQLADFRFAGALRKIAQSIGAPLAGAHFQGHQRHLLAQLRMARLEFAGHVLDRLVQAETGLHRDHQQVERIGQGKADHFLPFLDLLFEQHARQIPSLPHSRRPISATLIAGFERHSRLHHKSDSQHDQGAQNANSVKHRRARFGAEAGADQVDPEVGDSASEEGTFEPICWSKVTRVLGSPSRSALIVRWRAGSVITGVPSCLRKRPGL